MSAAETDLAMAMHHVAEAEEHIARQKDAIALSAAKGHDVTRAENTLRQLEYSLALAQRHVRRLRGKASPAQ